MKEVEEVELQILQTVHNWQHTEMPIMEIPFGVDANFSYCSIQSKTIDLAQRGYLRDRQMFFSLTDLGRAACRWEYSLNTIADKPRGILEVFL